MRSGTVVDVVPPEPSTVIDVVQPEPVIVVEVGEVSGPPGPQGLQGVPGPEGPRGVPGERAPILIDERVMAGDGVDVPLTVRRLDGGTY